MGTFVKKFQSRNNPGDICLGRGKLEKFTTRWKSYTSMKYTSKGNLHNEAQDCPDEKKTRLIFSVFT